jgi:hypothetical protein
MKPASVGRRAFRPLLWWAVTSAVFLLLQFHYTHSARAKLRFSVSMEGRAGEIAHNITLNQLPYRPGEKSGVGWKTLIIQAEDAEPFETNCFVWYGGKSFGNISLARSRGTLELDFSPAAAEVQITGPGTIKTITNSTHSELALPTGNYTVEARFEHFRNARTVDVQRNRKAALVWAPNVTTLNLNSDPDHAEFELNSRQQPEVSVRGTTPAILTGLPSGGYALSIVRGAYQKNLAVKLEGSKATNELMVEFRYAKLSVTSEPSGASISDGYKNIGTTPASLDLQPGSYNLEITKAGYFGTNFTLGLSETSTQALAVHLVNVSWVAALERAEQHSSGLFADYDAALIDVQKALEIKPGDTSALQLKQTLEFKRHLRNGRQFQKSNDYTNAFREAAAAQKLNPKDTEIIAFRKEIDDAKNARLEEQAQAARNRPQKLLEEIASHIRHSELFELQFMRLHGTPSEVRTGVMRGLGSKPEWRITRDAEADPEVLTIQAERKAFGSRHNVVLTIGQTGENEVTMCFKLLRFTLGEKLQLSLSGFSDDSYKPLHPNYVSATRAAGIGKELARDLEEFRKRLQDEFR